MTLAGDLRERDQRIRGDVPAGPEGTHPPPATSMATRQIGAITRIDDDAKIIKWKRIGYKNRKKPVPNELKYLDTNERDGYPLETLDLEAYRPFVNEGSEIKTAIWAQKRGAWIIEPTGIALEFAVFQVNSTNPANLNDPRLRDILIARRYSGTPTFNQDASKNVYVFKPYMLRVTPFDLKTRVGIKYEYDSVIPLLRKATVNSSGYIEQQAITPTYDGHDNTPPSPNPPYEGDLIIAARGIPGIAADFGDPIGKVEWIDMNNDARYWAQRSDV